LKEKTQPLKVDHSMDISEDEASRILAMAIQHRVNLDNEKNNSQKIAKVKASLSEENQRRSKLGIPLLKEHQQHQLVSNTLTSPLKNINIVNDTSIIQNSRYIINHHENNNLNNNMNHQNQKQIQKQNVNNKISQQQHTTKKRITKFINGVEYERVGGGWAPLNNNSLLWQPRDEDRIRKKLEKQKASSLYNEIIPTTTGAAASTYQDEKDAFSIKKNSQKTNTRRSSGNSGGFLPYLAVNSEGRIISVTQEERRDISKVSQNNGETRKKVKSSIQRRSQSASSSLPTPSSSSITQSLKSETRRNSKPLPSLGELAKARNRSLRSN